MVWCFGDPKETEAASTLRVVEAKLADYGRYLAVFGKRPPGLGDLSISPPRTLPRLSSLADVGLELILEASTKPIAGQWRPDVLQFGVH